MAMISEKGSKESTCGGTLLGKNAVVTAAHCVYDMERRDDFYVRLGAHTSEKYSSENNVEEFKIRDVSVMFQITGF